MSNDTLVKVENVSKKFCRSLKRSLWYGMQDLGNELLGRRHGGDGGLRPDEFWAVKDVCFELKRGECLGLIGRNGAGKTTLLRMLNGLIKPDMGRIEMHGRVGALIALGAGFNPILTGRENIYVNAAVLGFTKEETERKFDNIVEFSELSEFIDSPVQHYSSGMYVRLGFSIAANFNPNILLVDEALAVGDLAFAVRCLNRISELRKNGTAVIFVSHNELQVREAAQNCILLDHGHATRYESLDQAFLAYHTLRSDTALLDESDVGFVHDGPVRIKAICKKNTSDEILCSNETAMIELDCQTQMDCQNLGLELRFWTALGQLISVVKSSAYGVSFDLPKGESQIRVDIKTLALAPGRYRLAGGFRRDGEILGWSRDLAHINITPSQAQWSGEGILMLQAEFHGPFIS